MILLLLFRIVPQCRPAKSLRGSSTANEHDVCKRLHPTGAQISCNGTTKITVKNWHQSTANHVLSQVILCLDSQSIKKQNWICIIWSGTKYYYGIHKLRLWTDAHSIRRAERVFDQRLVLHQVVVSLANEHIVINVIPIGFDSQSTKKQNWR